MKKKKEKSRRAADNPNSIFRVGLGEPGLVPKHPRIKPKVLIERRGLVKKVVFLPSCEILQLSLYNDSHTAHVFYISLIYSNVCRVLSQCKTRLRLLC